MAYEGIFLRHYFNQRPDSGSDGAWTDSPDIIINGTQPAVDPSRFATRADYDTYPGNTQEVNRAINYVYVRGLNTASGPLDTRLWLYYAQSDMVLWPANWRQDNIIIDDPMNPRNWVEVRGIAPNAIGVGAPVFQWRPMGLDSGQHFCLIAFAENPPLSNPPVPPLPSGSMGTWNDLAAYVQANPNMAWRNTSPVNTAGPTWQRASRLTGARRGGEFRVGYTCNDMPTDGFLAFSVAGYDRGSTVVFPNPPVQKAPIYDSSQSMMVKITWRADYLSSLVLSYWQGATTPPRGANITPIIAVRSDELRGLLQGVSDEELQARSQKLRVYEHTGPSAAYEDEFVTIIGSMPYQF